MTTSNTWVQAPGKTGTFGTTLVLEPENAGGFVLFDTSVGSLTTAIVEGKAAVLECVIDVSQLPDSSGVTLYLKNDLVFENFSPPQSAPIFTVALKVFEGADLQESAVIPLNGSAQIMKWNVESGGIYVFGGGALHYASGP
jgi:hypothetical protein